MLKVPRWWLLILFVFVGLALWSYWSLTNREASVPGRYRAGTCLRNEDLGLIQKVERFENGSYVLSIIEVPEKLGSQTWRVGQTHNVPMPELESGSHERPVPCPDSLAP